jgi:hypothetical protein
MTPKMIAACTVILALGYATSASATIVTGTFTGTVSDGQDGPLGNAGHDITGYGISGTFFYDTSLLNSPYADANSASGNNLATGSPGVGGITWTVDRQTYSQTIVQVVYEFLGESAGIDYRQFQFNDGNLNVQSSGRSFLNASDGLLQIY